ncbi:MAG: ArdC family protein [Bacteroidia bacterium]
MKNDVFKKVAEDLKEMLKSISVNQFNYTWVFFNSKNPYTNHTYKGFNSLYLSFLCEKYKYNVNKWLTFNEIKQLGATIQKGAKASHIIFYTVNFYLKGKLIKPEDLAILIKETGKTEQELEVKRKPILKIYPVFNCSLINGLPENYYKNDDVFNSPEIFKHDRADLIIQNSGANIQFKLSDTAYYSRSGDYIAMPLKEQFKSVEGFYSTLFHELVHWTGSPDRLNRKKGRVFGDNDYAFEELVAELGSCFLCAQLGIKSDKREFNNNAAYLKSWLVALDNDVAFFVKACQYADKAANFLLDFEKVANAA